MRLPAPMHRVNRGVSIRSSSGPNGTNEFGYCAASRTLWRLLPGEPRRVRAVTRYRARMLETGRVDVVVVGAGLAGLVAVLELMERGDLRIVMVDRCAADEVGGLAREAFGGMFMVQTGEQRFSRIQDSVEL